MRKRQPVAIRLARNLTADAATGCLNWTGPVGHNGYGCIQPAPGRWNKRVHRVAYELAKGPIPDGMQIDHLCRNRLCCNPDHLEAVTREENISRGNAPHMVNARKTLCKRGHPLSGENLILRDRGERNCRICNNESAKQHARRKRAAERSNRLMEVRT